MKLEFPKGFLWGAATSAHQVEGDNVNDWTEWEKKHAEELAKNAGKKWAPWQQEKFPEMFKPLNYISGRACDHYHLFEQDFDIAKELGHNAHRFSIEWSRIEPEEGKFDEDEIEHYKRVVSALKERGIEPFVTLWHWTNPLWVRDTGGWENKKIIFYFSRYVEKIVSALGEDVKFWIVLNEPDDIYTIFSYLKGDWPPQNKSIIKTFRVLRNLVSAQKQAYKIIHKGNHVSQVGFANNIVHYESAGGLINNFLKSSADYFWNFWFLERTKKYNDFIGLNYYHHNLIKLGFNKNKNNEVTDFGWEICLEGLLCVLRRVKNYNLPVYITENGIADSRDEKRADFIKNHLIQISKATSEGVDVRGYLHWSFLDNFEWDKGFWPRFGLVEVNFKTMERKIRPSALEYKKIIENNALEI